MMLLICIAWILVVAKAPWWIWMAFILHVIGCFFAWLFETNDVLINLTDKFKKL